MVDIVEFQIAESGIDGLFVATMKQVTDARGTVREFFRASSFSSVVAGLAPWQQVNVTETIPCAIRGMHGEAMTKLVSVVAGSAHGAYVDTRAGSPTAGTVVEVTLEPGVQVLVPQGVCNGFQSGPDGCQYLYCFDQEWQPGMPGVAVSPLDPELGIEWPLDIDIEDESLLSSKDRNAPALAAVLEGGQP